MPNIQLAKNLRYLRKRNGLNQEDLKTLLNISRQAYSNYERCKRMPDLDTLVRISRFYHVPLDDLLLKNLRTSPAFYEGIRESASSYTLAKCKETGNSIYLTEKELDFLSSFRSVPEETRQIITGFLNQAKQE